MYVPLVPVIVNVYVLEVGAGVGGGPLLVVPPPPQESMVRASAAISSNNAIFRFRRVVSPAPANKPANTKESVPPKGRLR